MASEETRNKAAMVFSVVESVILAMSVGLMCWLSRTVIEHGNSLAGHTTMLNINSGRITSLEQYGSRGLGEHEKLDDARVGSLGSRMDKVEQAVLVLQNTPSRLDNVQASLIRIERILEEHMKETKKP